jgi:transmembrane sensor
MDSRLKRLGADIADAQGASLRAFDVQAQRARFLASVAVPGAVAVVPAPKKAMWSPRRQWVAIGLASSAVAVAAALALFFRQPSLRFDVGGVTGQEGEWIAAPSGDPLPVAFSDGTRLFLAETARARVSDSAPNGARVVLERGRIAADVVHRENTRWRVDAGPFTIQVVGTRFEVSWDPAQEQFHLVLQEGSVRVAGPTIPQGRTVRAGDHLDVVVGGGARNEAVLPSPSGRAIGVTDPAGTTVPHAPAPAPAAAAPVAPPAPLAPPVAWRALAAKGIHQQAWKAIESAGFDVVLSRASAAELVTVADVARFSHHPAQAATALSTLRKRFPKDVQAGESAFLLGRLAYDQDGSPSEAARWFSTYLKEHPSGRFAREAAGRLIECHQRLGADDAARVTAERYLAAYPGGPHAMIARRLLDSTSGPTSGDAGRPKHP